MCYAGVASLLQSQLDVHSLNCFPTSSNCSTGANYGVIDTVCMHDAQGFVCQASPSCAAARMVCHTS
jgi:hypothetical protein